MDRTLVEKQFGAAAADYAASAVHASGPSLGRLVALVSPKPDWRVLDVATGAGHTALAFAPLVTQVFASDITPAMLAEAQRLASARGLVNVATAEAEAGALPFADGEFDLVTCRLAAHHFPDQAAFVSEAWRVLKPGGTIAIVDNVGPDRMLLPGMAENDIKALGEAYEAYERLRDPSHVRCPGLNEWLAILARAGFEDVRRELLDQDIQFVPWLKRMRCDVDTAEQLEAMLEDEPLRSFLRPREEAGERLFTLREAIIVARKPD